MVEKEYCVICGEEIAEDDYAEDNVKVPVGMNNDYSCHVTCEEQEDE